MVPARSAPRGVAWGWLALWGAFVAYAAFAAPPDDPAFTRALIKGSLTGDFAGINPAVAAVFSLLGVVPVLASSFVLRDGARDKLPAWPFALGMFFVGAFALLPWLALRRMGAPRAEPRVAGPVRRLLARPLVRWGLLAATLALVAWALARGSLLGYVGAFRTTSMVHVMTIDLALCAALLLRLVEEARAGGSPTNEPAVARSLRFVPLFGSLLWNALTRRAP